MSALQHTVQHVVAISRCLGAPQCRAILNKYMLVASEHAQHIKASNRLYNRDASLWTLMVCARAVSCRGHSARARWHAVLCGCHGHFVREHEGNAAKLSAL